MGPYKTRRQCRIKSGSLCDRWTIVKISSKISVATRIRFMNVIESRKACTTIRKADSRRLNEPVKAIATSRVSEVTRDIRAERVVPREERRSERLEKRDKRKCIYLLWDICGYLLIKRKISLCQPTPEDRKFFPEFAMCSLQSRKLN